ncbi:MAG TPA: DnaB-like helicase C-terminal domain-containing protein, partial [Conexibacter sp.]|nr:DnaB-like helicase C-terminal domain-containing protein [Conexibacter sp.]
MTAAKKKAEPEPAPAAGPRNLDIERAVLGAALISTKSADYVLDRITTSTLFRKAHQQILACVKELRDVNAGVDIVVVKERLGPMAMEDIGGPAYLASLVDGVPRSTNLEHYLDVLKDLEAKRALLAFAGDVSSAVLDTDHSSRQIMADADRRLLELQSGHAAGAIADLRQSCSELLNDLQFRVDHRGELTGVDTGFESINQLTLGWQAGDLIVLAARPSIGKTTFAINSAVAGARTGKRVAFFSLEMKRRQLEYRILSSLSEIPLSRLLGGHLAERDAAYPRLNAALEIMHGAAIYIDDASGRTAWDVRSACRRLKGDGGLD